LNAAHDIVFFYELVKRKICRKKKKKEKYNVRKLLSDFKK
jgi:hypothetical protein